MNHVHIIPDHWPTRHPAPQPTDLSRRAINQQHIARVTYLRRAAAVACGLCLECEQPTGDAALVWHPGCAPERGM